MKEYENDLYLKNIKYIAGTDEVGRGPLAGPVVAAAVIFDKDYENKLINDSKKLSSTKRNELYKIIKNDALSYSIISIDVETIDKLNIKEASKLAMKKSIESLDIKPEHVLVDYENIDIEIPQTSIVKGDEKSISIAAASILAKVSRDKYMIELSKKYNKYQFEKNMGYGTKYHRESIIKNGWTPEHRKSFNPVKSLLKK
ncbi:MAG: ribonuclease HII [Mycoplasma sp.]|nr:ribonuclease HII [Mycoplasma sp.]